MPKKLTTTPSSPSPAPIGSATRRHGLRAKLYVRLTARRAEMLGAWKEDAIRMHDFESAATLRMAQKCLERFTTIKPNAPAQRPPATDV